MSREREEPLPPARVRWLNAIPRLCESPQKPMQDGPLPLGVSLPSAYIPRVSRCSTNTRPSPNSEPSFAAVCEKEKVNDAEKPPALMRAGANEAPRDEGESWVSDMGKREHKAPEGRIASPLMAHVHGVVVDDGVVVEEGVVEGVRDIDGVTVGVRDMDGVTVGVRDKDGVRVGELVLDGVNEGVEVAVRVELGVPVWVELRVPVWVELGVAV